MMDEVRALAERNEALWESWKDFSRGFFSAQPVIAERDTPEPESRWVDFTTAANPPEGWSGWIEITATAADESGQEYGVVAAMAPDPLTLVDVVEAAQRALWEAATPEGKETQANLVRMRQLIGGG